jgi:hypothetical protein
MSERDLELLLQRTAAAMPYPATPQLRASVLTAIAGHDVPQAPSPARRRPAFALATVVAAIAALAATLALAIPSSRTAIADLFGIDRSKIERLPSPAPGTTATPLPAPADLPPGARPASLDEAGEALGFAPASPSVLGQPEAVYVVDYPSESVVILRYADFDVWQAQPRGGVFVKGVPEGVNVLELRTSARRDVYFIEGGPHIVRIVDDVGQVPGSERTVDRNTLIFESERAFYRIETDLPRSPALLELADVLP